LTVRRRCCRISSIRAVADRHPDNQSNDHPTYELPGLPRPLLFDLELPTCRNSIDGRLSNGHATGRIPADGTLRDRHHYADATLPIIDTLSDGAAN
jgi:hypothetical protein